MHHEECKDYDAENEHILGCPLNAGSGAGNGVAVVTAGLAVLDCKPECVDNVDDEQKGKAHRCDKRIPVGTEELANHIIGCGPNQSHRVHQHVKSYE